MQKTLPVFFWMCILMVTACTPQAAAATPPPLPTPAAAVETQTPTAATPTAVDPTPTRKAYANSLFGFGFQYPADWFGPEETISDQTLRVEVGSDKVYPYGERPEQPSDGKNSYNVVLQYTKANQNPFWKEPYQALQNLKDGESVSDTRSLITRVKAIDLGRFQGFEYIFTLPETAQTEHVYGREVMLLDEQTNDLLTIMGQPDNVAVSDGAQWRDVYRSIDEANLDAFHVIVESIKVE